MKSGLFLLLAGLTGGILLSLLAGSGQVRASGPVPMDDPEVVELIRVGSASVLPDLRTLPHDDIYLQKLQNSDIVRLRFSNTIWNSGPGDLELFGSLERIWNTVQVFQVIETGLQEPFVQESGRFAYHDEHGHWHWDGFSLYRVWSIDGDGNLVDIVASSGKVGYCLIDVELYEGPGREQQDPPPFRQFGECDWEIQGLSSGWTDTYEAHIGGQFVDISHLDDGAYALVTTVDPDDIIIETNDANNSAVTYFRLIDGELLVGSREPVSAEGEVATK